MKFWPAIRRLFIFVLIIVCASFLSGCWNRRELNTLGITGAIAIDLDGDKVKATAEIIKPKPAKNGGKSGGKSEESAIYVQSTGSSIFDALRNTTLKCDRKLFLAITKVYVFSEAAARKGLAEYLEIWQRDHEPGTSSYVLIAKDSTAAEVIGIAGGVEDIPSDYLESLIKNQKVNSKTVVVRVRDFLMAYYDKGTQPVAGIVQKMKKEDPVKEDKDVKGKEELIIEGSAVFSEDKMLGFLDGTETRGLNFINNDVKSGIVVSKSPDGSGDNSIEILKAKSKNDVEIDGEEAKIKVKITMDGAVDEETGKIDLKDPAVVEKVEKANSKKIREEIENVIKKAQTEYKLDIFKFGQIVHRKYPDEWKEIQDDWDEIFSRAEINVEVETNITRTGKVNIPIREKEEK